MKDEGHKLSKDSLFCVVQFVRADPLAHIREPTKGPETYAAVFVIYFAKHYIFLTFF